ncbi:hypothetical protein ACN4EE_13055 [Geminocystis sp. CENA526]|uniref:hypothetical protein n=1 Tax=Geminocystis sp. CENA526 TaxID=1355871 RepID=UPI003D6EA629
MKKIELKKLNNQNLFTEKEGFFVENEGKILGIYYPMIDHHKVKQAKEKMDLVMSKILEETGLTEEEYTKLFTL